MTDREPETAPRTAAGQSFAYEYPSEIENILAIEAEAARAQRIEDTEVCMAGQHLSGAAAEAEGRVAGLLDDIRDRWQEARVESEGNRIVASADDRTAFDRGVDHAERIILAVLRATPAAAAPAGSATSEAGLDVERLTKAMQIVEPPEPAMDIVASANGFEMDWAAWARLLAAEYQRLLAPAPEPAP